MTARIQGMGWVTPLGVGLEDVRDRLRQGARAEARELKSSSTGRTHYYHPVPPKLVEALGRNPRLRRSSSISYFAATAGLAALEHSGLKMTPELAAHTAVIFAIASGGVAYTRRFYEQIVTQGANAASPLLFPETVYNAPASHLAALLGIDGLSYTLVGDQSVGLSALKFAEQLLATTDVEHCVVVGAEEVDPILCDAYAAWRLLSPEPSLQLDSNRGTLLAEGAAALVVGRTGPIALAQIHPGVSFFDRRAAGPALRQVHAELKGEVATVVCSANGTFIDAAENAALDATHPGSRRCRIKASLGEAIGASALLQTIVAALELGDGAAGDAALVSVLGWNQQAGGLVLQRV